MIKRLNKFKCLFLFLFIFLAQSSFGQNKNKVSLLDILNNLEKKHEVRFSYATQDIVPIQLFAPPEDYTLIQSLSYLAEKTPFIFNQINERYITVVLKEAKSSFCGKVLDIKTGLPLSEANILVSNPRFSTTTNAQGYFYIAQEASNQTVTIQYLGFQPITIHIKALGADCLPIYLQPLTDILDEVLIKSLFVKGVNKQLDGAITLNTSNFGLLPGQIEDDVLQIVQALPGIESVDETISNINIRGGSHDENLILWDGIKMYQTGHFFGLISAFNPNLTKNVIIYKNGTPARYGEGVSGIIDMRSDDKLVQSISGGAGSNLINASAFLTIPISEKSQIQVSGRRAINDIFETPVYTSYSERIFQDTEIVNIQDSENSTRISANEDFNFYDFSSKLLWDISEKDNLQINFLTIDNTLDFTETLNESSSSKTSELRQQSMVGGVSWSHIWNDNIKTNALAYGTYYLLDAVNKDVFTTQEQRQENEVLETGIKLDASLKLSEKNTLKTGYQFSETGVANTQDVNLPRFRNYKKDVLRSHIAFAGLEYKPNGKNTVINGGVRVNYFTKFNKILVEPRISVHQTLGNGFAVETMGEFKSQTTSQRIDFESDFLGVEKRRWVLATDDDIPLIQSKQVSLGFIYTQDNWFINLEGFYKLVEGITASSQGFQNQYQFTRTTGSYKVKGAEFILNRKTKSFSSWISYTFLKNNYNFDSLSPVIFPNNLDIQHSVNLAGSYSIKNLKYALGFNWHSGKPYTIPLKDNEFITENGQEIIQYDTANAERLPDYLRTDLSAEYLWEINENVDAKFNFALLNLFSNDNTLNIHYALNSDENGDTQINKIEEVSLGFTPNFSFQVLF